MNLLMCFFKFQESSDICLVSSMTPYHYVIDLVFIFGHTDIQTPALHNGKYCLIKPQSWWPNEIITCGSHISKSISYSYHWKPVITYLYLHKTVKMVDNVCSLLNTCSSNTVNKASQAWGPCAVYFDIYLVQVSC